MALYFKNLIKNIISINFTSLLLLILISNSFLNISQLQAQQLTTNLYYGRPVNYTIIQTKSDGTSTQYNFNIYYDTDENGNPKGIAGDSWVNFERNSNFEKYFTNFDKVIFQKLSQVEKEKVLLAMIAFKGLPLDADPSEGSLKETRRQELLSTEFYTLPRSKQVEFYMNALGDSFWETGADTSSLVRELLKEKDGIQIAGDLLCKNATQYIQGVDLQYYESEDAEVAGDKLKEIFKANPKLKTEICEVHGIKVDLQQIAKSAEIQGRAVKNDRALMQKNKISEQMREKLRDFKNNLKCDSANLSRVFDMSVSSLTEASPGVQSFIAANFDRCTLQGRLEKGANNQYFFKFGFGNLNGERINLKDLAQEWGLSIKLPSPVANPMRKTGLPQKGSAGR